jgi:hypothetical protein
MATTEGGSVFFHVDGDKRHMDWPPSIWYPRYGYRNLRGRGSLYVHRPPVPPLDPESSVGLDKKAGVGRPWAEWLVRLALVLVSSGVTATLLNVAIRMTWGPPSPRPAVALKPILTAQVVGNVAVARGGSNDQVALSWQVSNTGDAPWPVDAFRFVPDGATTPVISLPFTVEPGKTVTVKVLLDLQDTPGVRNFTWQLSSFKGRVDGGKLVSEILVEPASDQEKGR